jgi:ankyrin repeat protein
VTPIELRLAVAEYLNIADINALMRTSHDNHRLFVAYLYQRAKDSDQARNDGYPFFFVAVGDDNRTAVNRFLEAGASVRMRDNPNGRTALHVCASRGLVAIGQLMIANGADVSAADASGETPLHAALLYNDSPVPVMQSLADAGADLDATCEEFGSVARLAAFSNQVAALEFLIDAGANISAPDGIGQTPLHSAGAEAVPVLLAAGLNLEHGDLDGRTALHRAAICGAAEHVAAFLRFGANVMATDIDGNTPLHFAVGYRGGAAIAARLVQLGQTMPDALSQARLDTALPGVEVDSVTDISLHIDPSEHTVDREDEIIEALLANGADIGAMNAHGCSPLHWAVFRSTYINSSVDRPDMYS